MIDPTRERCALGDATLELVRRLRVLLKFDPQVTKAGYHWQDADGQWWSIVAQRCADEAEAARSVDWRDA